MSTQSSWSTLLLAESVIMGAALRHSDRRQQEMVQLAACALAGRAFPMLVLSRPCGRARYCCTAFGRPKCACNGGGAIATE